jgi:hypothetical protein
MQNQPDQNFNPILLEICAWSLSKLVGPGNTGGLIITELIDSFLDCHDLINAA